MTAMPSMKLTSLPSRRCVAPSATPISAKTRHAAGIENFFWTSISGLCGDWPALTSASARARSSAMVISRSPRAGPARGNTLSGSSETTISANRATS